MKRYMMTLVALFAWMGISAMDYETARERAYYLTDKMAYELNLNDQQYNDAYEINLDYLLSINTEADLADARYLAYRNDDLRHILYDWQWMAFAAVDYLFRPLWWLNGGWYFPVYNYYAHGYYFYHHPRIYWDYRGGHGRFYFSGGFYHDRRPMWHGGLRGMNRTMIGHPNPGGGRYGHPGGGRGIEHRGGGYSFGHSSHRPNGGSNMHRPEGGHNNGGYHFDRGGSNRNGGHNGGRPEGGNSNRNDDYRPEGGSSNHSGSHYGNSNHSSRSDMGSSRPQGSTNSNRGNSFNSSSRSTVGNHGSVSNHSGMSNHSSMSSRGSSTSRGSSVTRSSGSSHSPSGSRGSGGGSSRGSRGGGRH